MRLREFQMKKSFFICLTAAVLFSTAAVFAQTIPPYGENQNSPESIPTAIDRDKDMPCRPGCYVVDGGLSFYYQSGEYYQTDRTTTTYTTITDSKGGKYTPWGVQFNPSAEFFMFKNFAFGGMAEFGYESMGSDSRIMLGIGPVISYYFTSFGRIIPYLSAFALYEHSNDYLASTESMYWTDQAEKVGIKIGSIFMFSRQGGFFADFRFTYEIHDVSTPPATTQKSETAWNACINFGFKYFMF
jgi:hypothetical protein